MTTHLFVRSCYTLLDSTIRIPELVSTAKKYGYQSVALTDHHVMHGIARFLHECNKEESFIRFAYPLLFFASSKKGTFCSW